MIPGGTRCPLCTTFLPQGTGHVCVGRPDAPSLLQTDAPATLTRVDRYIIECARRARDPETALDAVRELLAILNRHFPP